MSTTEVNPKRLSFWISRGVAIFLALSLLAGFIPQTASAKYDPDDCDYIYNVRRGATLTSIAKAYGTSPNQIVYANDMDRPYTIYVGQKLCIPEKDKKGLSKLASKYADAVAVHFTAGRSGNNIIVYTYNYPKTKVLIKGENAGASGWKLVNIGSFNIAKVGNQHSLRFKLPTELQVANLLICLKSMNTGYLQCVTPRTGGS
jgi:LysM repeat protein